MARYITTLLVFIILMAGLGAMLEGGISFWDSAAYGAYTDSTEVNPALVQTNPAFQGMESGYSSDSIHVTNEYGDYMWEVNECWLAAFPGVAALWQTGTNPRTGLADMELVAAHQGREILIYDWVGADYLSLLYDNTTQNAIYDAYDAAAPAANHRFHGEVGYELQVTDPTTPISTAAPELIYLKHDGTEGIIGTKVAGDLLLDAFADVYTMDDVGIGIAAPTEILHVVGSPRFVDGNEAVGFVWTDDGTGTGVGEWAAPGGVAAHDILDGVVHTDSVADAVTRGSLIYGNSTPKWDELIIGGVGNVLTSDGTDAAWAAPAVQTSTLLDGTVHTDTVADAVTRGSIIYGNATPKWDELIIGGVGEVLTSDGTDAAWAAPFGAPDQNLWESVGADAGGVATANTTTDTLTISGTGSISTERTGDTIEILFAGDSAHFGDGSDGNVTTGGDVTITRDMYYDILVISAGDTLYANGYKIFCKTSATINGTLEAKAVTAAVAGSAGGNGNGGGGLGGAGGAGATYADTNRSITIGDDGPAGSAGGNGGSGVAGSAGAAGNAGTGATNSIGSSGSNGAQGGAGGASGTGDAGGAGGAAGAAGTASSTANSGGMRHLEALTAWRVFPVGGAIAEIRGNAQQGGASGGGGGGANGGASAGGGGGAGGAGLSGRAIYLAAKAITVGGAGVIDASGSAGANGGNGGNAFDLGGGDGGGGGGGAGGAGGNGGIIVLVYVDYTNGGSVTVAAGAAGTGGTGGTAVGGGAAGTNGANGTAGSAGEVIEFAFAS